MSGEIHNKVATRLRHAATKLLQAGALTLVVALAIPARAEDQRAVKSRVPPVYPEIAKRMKITGVVHLEVTVDPAGKVKEVKTVTGSKFLSTAAEEAVRQWKFVSGEGVATVPVDVNFALAQ